MTSTNKNINKKKSDKDSKIKKAFTCPEKKSLFHKIKDKILGSK